MDDPYSKRAYNDCKCEKRSIGVINPADATAREIVLKGLEGSEYIYRETKRLFKIQLSLGGAYNLYNSMVAICAALELGITPCVAKEALKSLQSIDGRLEIIRSDVTVIIDYAHTEEAFINVLKLLNSTKNNGQKLITVFGCGGERDREKRPKIARAAELLSELVIVTSDNSRKESVDEIIDDILAGFKRTDTRKIITSRKAAIEHAILTADTGDLIAIIGKGHEKYNIDKDGYHDFDERRIIHDALAKRGYALTHDANNSGT